MKRRAFLETVLLSSAGAVLYPAFAQAGGLRTITYNVLQCSGWPKEVAQARVGGFAEQMPARYAMELALYRPDIITYQECPEESVIKAIAEHLGMNYVLFESGGYWPGALMTRFEILAWQNHPTVDGERPEALFTRHWGKARLRDAERDQEYVVHSAHLHPSDDAIRHDEVTAMLEAMRDEIAADTPMILQGDLNHDPDKPSYARWQEAGLVDCYAKAGEGEAMTFTADTPSVRIDYVWVNAALAGRLTSARTLYEGAFRLNLQDEQSFALSDHLPVLAAFSA